MVVAVVQSSQGMLLSYPFSPFTYRNVSILWDNYDDIFFLVKCDGVEIKSEGGNKLSALERLSGYSLLQLLVISNQFASINLIRNILG